MEEKELESLDYLIKKFRKAKDKRPIFSEALKTVEEHKEALIQGMAEPLSRSFRPPQLGNDDAPVTIIEFMDFQCPPCKKARTTIKKVLRNYPREVRLIFRNFPKIEKHPFAVRAAEAALCAYEQGMFWEYYELLFENQRSLNKETLLSLGREVGLDMPRFESCLLLNEAGKRVVTDMELGLEFGVKKVPTFFINGIKIEGRKSIYLIEEIIKGELEQ